MFVDPRARKRYKAIQNVAKTIRIKSNGNTQTTVRTGKHDFLLRHKVRGDTTPWGQIPPVKLDQNLPDFEIGLYRDIYITEQDEDERQTEIEDDIQAQNEDDLEISNEVKRQYLEDQNENENTKKEKPVQSVKPIQPIRS